MRRAEAQGLSPLIDELRCLSCGGRLALAQTRSDSRVPGAGPRRDAALRGLRSGVPDRRRHAEDARPSLSGSAAGAVSALERGLEAEDGRGRQRRATRTPESSSRRPTASPMSGATSASRAASGTATSGNICSRTARSSSGDKQSSTSARARDVIAGRRPTTGHRSWRSTSAGPLTSRGSIFHPTF